MATTTYNMLLRHLLFSVFVSFHLFRYCPAWVALGVAVVAVVGAAAGTVAWAAAGSG